MKSPRMLRPLMILGIVVIVVAVLSFLFNPDWSRSPIGLLILILAVIIGIAAVVRDMRAFAKDVKELEKKE